MRRFLIFAVALFASVQLWAGPVDMVTARETAQRFVQEKSHSGKLNGALSGQLTLAHTEWNSRMLDRAAFYVFNTSGGYIIVSGDDRAEPILGYGDMPLDMNNLPCNLREWLGTYKVQLEYLQAHEELVAGPNPAPLNIASVAPLLTCNWDQEAPYWNQCIINNVQCLTGCPATSAAMVFYYWKFPDFETPQVPAYRCELSTSYWGGASYVNVAALPPVVFDWDNMKDNYGSNYTTAQGNAVATLMRYVGQAEHMAYGSSSAGGSGVDADSVILIANAFKLFGYDEETVRVVKKTSAYSGGQTLYTDAQWAALIQEEMAEGRPVVFCAISSGWGGGGHAFNVDGYDASTNKYHINFGWSGSYNNYYALNAFNGGGDVFNQYQQMVIGIQPGNMAPRLKVNTESLSMECFKGQTASAAFVLSGSRLEDAATLTLNDPEGVFTLSENTMPIESAKSGKTFTVTFAPTASTNYTATITCSTPGAEDVTVQLTGNAPYELYRPELLPLNESEITATSFRADWSDATPEENVSSYTLEVMPRGDVKLLTQVDFSGVPNESVNHASDAQNYLPDDWTFTGSRFYLDGGFVSPGRDCVLSANCDLSGYSRVSVIIKAKNYPKGTTNTDLTVFTSEDSKKIYLAPELATYLVVLDCNNDGVVSVKTGYYPEIQSIQIIGGEILDPGPFTMSAPSLRGNDDNFLFEGIAPDMTSFIATGLTAGQAYFYHVKALYVNGTESAWSSIQEVVLPDLDVQLGDLDKDGIITLGDVTALIDYLVNGVVGEGMDMTAADYDQDGAVTLGDATSLIDYLMKDAE